MNKLNPPSINVLTKNPETKITKKFNKLNLKPLDLESNDYTPHTKKTLNSYYFNGGEAKKNVDWKKSESNSENKKYLHNEKLNIEIEYFNKENYKENVHASGHFKDLVKTDNENLIFRIKFPKSSAGEQELFDKFVSSLRYMESVKETLFEKIGSNNLEYNLLSTVISEPNPKTKNLVYSGKILVKNGGQSIKDNFKIDLIKPMLIELKKIHEAGFAHRDIKSDNILIGDDGYLRLIDWDFLTDTNRLQKDDEYKNNVLIAFDNGDNFFIDGGPRGLHFIEIQETALKKDPSKFVFVDQHSLLHCFIVQIKKSLGISLKLDNKLDLEILTKIVNPEYLEDAILLYNDPVKYSDTKPISRFFDMFI